MTLRSRLMFGLVAALVIFTMAPSSFAQVNVQLITQPSLGEIQTNRNGQTGDSTTTGNGILVSGQLIATAPLTTTKLLLTYPAIITSSGTTLVKNNGQTDPLPTANSNIPTGDPIRVEGATGLFAYVTQALLNTASKRIEIFLPGFQTAPNTLSGSFRLVGVRIDTNGLTGAQSVTGALDSSSNNYILITSTATIINSIGAGIGNFAVGARSGQTDQGTATVFTPRTAIDAEASIILAEGFAAAFRTVTQSANSGASMPNGTRIRLTFNGVPSGLTLSLGLSSAATLAAEFASAATNGSRSPTAEVQSTSNVVYIDFDGTSMSTTETLMVRIRVSTGSTSSLATGSVSVTATMVPIGDAVDASGNPFQDSGPANYPRFAQADLGPITIVNIVPSTTTMLIPYAVKAGGFDTGIAVANTTADPFGGTAGGGAIAANGSIKFDFFPTKSTGGADTPFSVTTSSTIRPGNPTALSTDGTLQSGAVFTAQLSEVMALASPAQTGNFFGYLFITANFLNAHGAAMISDYRSASLTMPVLILPPPGSNPRSSPTHGASGAEQLLY